MNGYIIKFCLIFSKAKLNMLQMKACRTSKGFTTIQTEGKGGWRMKVLCSHQRGRHADLKELVPLRVRTTGILRADVFAQTLSHIHQSATFISSRYNHEL